MLEGTIMRGCCLNDCNDGYGYKAYFCSEDRCNGINSDSELLGKTIFQFQ